jgi:prepilin-type N-terminal cleavage/methylation domain-containing protein
MKKGFSLVEIMVVMVVIGIIVALGIKGSALVNTSRIRAEIAKLRNFETGFAGYFLKNNTLPPKDDDNLTTIGDIKCYITQRLLDRQVIAAEDVPSAFSHNSESWNFCTNIADNTTNGNVFGAAGFPVENVGVYSTGLNYELICNIEGILDDGSEFGGSGRVLDTLNNPLELATRNCDDLKNKSLYAGYIYIVFSPNSLIPKI